MNELEAKLGEYTTKTIPLSKDDGGGFKAFYEELGQGIKGYAESPDKAAADLMEVATDVLADEPIDNMPAPLIQMPWSEFSGGVTLRLPKALHAQLDRLADQQGVSLNQLMTHALQSAATTLSSGCEFGALSPATEAAKPKQRVAESPNAYSGRRKATSKGS